MPKSRRKSDIRAAAIQERNALCAAMEAKREAGVRRDRPWRLAFLFALEQGKTVNQAIILAGKSRSGVFKARKADPIFAQAWSNASAKG